MIWHQVTHWPTHWPTHPPIGIFKQNQIILISSNFIKLVIWPDPTHWSIHPPIGVGVSTNHKSSNRIELSQLGQDLLNFWWFDLTHQLTHWTTHPPTHPPMGGCVSTNHKSSNRIGLSQLGQDLFNCYSFDLTPTIDPLNHPTTHTRTHGWGCLYKS